MRDGKVEFMTVPQVVEESGDSRTTVYYHIRMGYLPVVRLHNNRLLVRRADYEAWNGAKRRNNRKVRKDRGRKRRIG